MKLSKRLQAVADLVTEGLVVADVGTDHGYIPIYLIETGKCKSAFAMDVNKSPLMRAREHIVESNLQGKIETRQSDGVKALKIGECQSVVVAGMGGALTIRIMEEGEEIFRSLQEFVLQPQSELDKVRHFLQEHNYSVIKEDMIFEDGKFYPMMKVINQKSDNYNEMEFCYGKGLLQQRHPVLEKYLKKEIETKRQVLKHLEQETGEHIEKRVAELERELLTAMNALQVYF